MRNNAFQNVLGEAYELLKYAYPHHDEFQQAVADQVNSFDRQTSAVRMLEAGIGSGVSAHTILRTCDDVYITGVDNAPIMLEQAAVLLQQYSTRVTLVCEDLRVYMQQCADNSFDVFVAVWTLHNLPPAYRTDVFHEIRRILTPGGRCVLGDKYAVADAAVHTKQLHTQLDRFRSFADKGGSSKLVEEWVAHNIEDDHIRITEKEQVHMLLDIGCTDVRTVYRQDMEAVIVGTCV
jgi:ubiquinone/menaquinone biosynthesis C-methylase UbiE